MLSNTTTNTNINVALPNNTTLTSTTVGHLQIPQLVPTAWKAYVLLGLSNTSILSLGQLAADSSRCSWQMEKMSYKFRLHTLLYLMTKNNIVWKKCLLTLFCSCLFTIIIWLVSLLIRIWLVIPSVCMSHIGGHISVCGIFRLTSHQSVCVYVTFWCWGSFLWYFVGHSVRV